MSRRYAIATNDCEHHHLHPARHDGGHTICLDCGSHVIITEGRHANGLSAIAERDKLLDILDAASQRVEEWARTGTLTGSVVAPLATCRSQWRGFHCEKRGPHQVHGDIQAQWTDAEAALAGSKL